MHPLFTLLVFFLLTLPAFAYDCYGRYLENQFEIEEINGLQFGRAQNSDGTWKSLKMNIYLPKDDEATNRPLLIYITGGSFIGASRDAFEATVVAKELAKKGYVTASIDYRVESNFIALAFPEIMIRAVIRAVQDAKAAVRFFRKDVAESGNTYGIDADNIFIGGCSAGGITALHLAYMDDMSELEPQFLQHVVALGGLDGESGNPGYSSRVKGVISVSGAIKNRSYMDNNPDIPVLCIHSTNDLSIPYTYGSPYFIPTLPMVHGSKHIDTYARNKGIKSTLYTLLGFVHIPYGNNPDTFNPVVFDSSMTLMSRFMYENSGCGGVPTPVSDNATTSLQLYPNPTGGLLYLGQTSGQDLYSITLTNSFGQKVARYNLHRGQQHINLKASGIAPGLYFVSGEDRTGNILATGKVVVR
jgi:para-nitrobenzyl esterase